MWLVIGGVVGTLAVLFVIGTIMESLEIKRRTRRCAAETLEDIEGIAQVAAEFPEAERGRMFDAGMKELTAHAREQSCSSQSAKSNHH